ncbi:MAG: TrkH family potassium uptake protein [Clostridia bacterium]|nr:TrkH family potassium uptake protein [Clostridia bacterium]
MNHKIVVKVLGSILIVEALLMLFPLLVSVLYSESAYLAFVITIIIMVVTGLILKNIKPDSNIIKTREGFAIVSFGWIAASFFGCLPFIISGAIPSPVNAFFETVSGLTTTGASILTDIESLPKGILFWRSFTHWIGGMGILVFTVALLPAVGAGGFQIFKAESPGPISDKIAPRIKDTAKILYVTYIIITAAETILLLFGGLSLYDALVHTFGTVGTGGFSSHNKSIAAFNSTYVYMVISFFMLMSGMNFSLFYELYKGRFRNFLKDQELRFYLSIVAGSILLISINVYGSIYSSIGKSLEQSIFQVISITTTTGYATADFDTWPTFSKMILFVLMFAGGCAGSTGGSVKQIRLLLIIKLLKREFQKIFHPRAMIPLKINDRSIPSDVTANVTSFLALYLGLFVFGTIIVSLEDISMVTAASSVAATLGNIGPGFELVGATQNYEFFSNPTKLLLSFFMLAGRLELFTIITLLSPSFWRSER